MKTKTLLIAAAALAAGVISSQAQVYSQNIVGYVNGVNTPSQYSAFCNPLDAGTVGGNNLTNVCAAVPKGGQVLLWRPSSGSYASYTRNAITGAWPAGADTNIIYPGQGFFVKTASLITNTWVGNVSGGANSTNTIALTAGVYQYVSSPLPIAGNLTDVGTNTLNLGVVLAKGSQVLAWTGSQWQTATKNAITGVWNTNLFINVGQGFMVKPTVSTNWVQYLVTQP